MPWIDNPTTGWIAGTATGPDGKGIDGATVAMQRVGWSLFRRTDRTKTDGIGWFGFAGVAAGRYEIRIGKGARVTADIVAGKVSRVELHAISAR